MTSLPKQPTPSFPALTPSATAGLTGQSPVKQTAISYANVSKTGLPPPPQMASPNPAPPTIQMQQPTPLIPSAPSPPPDARATLWFGDLEQWMDEAYIRQVCDLLEWDVSNIKLIRPANSPVSASGPTPNNAGYCFVTFPTANLAAKVLTSLTPSPTNPPVIMPNSTRPFKANWASSSMEPMPTPAPTTEFSIFVGDLAPEVSEADLVSVFLNPPGRQSFASARSAKIMNDVGGGSRGYGFVRFADEADQQRALVEMQGVYCLSRPMRISHATAKNKANLGVSTSGLSSSSQGQPSPAPASSGQTSPAFTMAQHIAPPGPTQQEPFLQTVPPRSVTTPVAQQQYQQQQLQQAHYLAQQQAQHQQFVYQQNMGYPPSIPGMDLEFAAPMSSYPDPNAKALEAVRALASAEGQPQASSTDPTNTTVFVGGLSSLISEETLKTFFVPFGEITYVKIPPGKGCGFVQFVRKTDAERAIDRMQGFPIGGGRIRLSWGRSQSDKAAQAATQAAQLGLGLGALTGLNGMTAAQAAQLGLALQGLQGLSGGNANLLRQLAAVTSTQQYQPPQPQYGAPPMHQGYPINGHQPMPQQYPNQPQNAYPARTAQQYAPRPTQPYIQQLQQQSQFGFAPFSPAHSPVTHAKDLEDEDAATFQKASYPSSSSLAGSQSSAFSAPRSRGMTSASSSLSVGDDRQGFDSRIFGAFSPTSSAAAPDFRTRMSQGDIHRPPNADPGRQRASSIAATGYGDLSLDLSSMHLTPQHQQPFSAYGSYPGSRPPAGRSFEEE